MPWTPADANRFVRNLTDKQKRQWAEVANAALEKCQRESRQNCEAEALRMAAAVVKESAQWRPEDEFMESDALKARVQSILTFADDMLGDAEVIDTVKSAVKNMGAMLRKRYAAMLAAPPPQPASAVESEIPFSDEFLPLKEGAIRRDGTIPIKIMQAGWGNSGFYPKEVLERDGPKVFTKGTKMFWDHPTQTEEAERPERSLRDLAGELVTNAAWKDSGPDGPGLYADAKVFDHFKDAVSSMAPNIGLSILGSGMSRQGEAEGRSGPVIERIAQARSVDFVTSPAAGGKILQLFEAARSGAREEESMELKEALATISDQTSQIASLTEANKSAIADKAKAEKERDEALQEAARLREAGLGRSAKDIVIESLSEIDNLPEVTKKRLAESLSKNPPVDEDGKLDKKAFSKKIEEAIKEEVKYLVEATGSDKIIGAGPGGETANEDSIKEANAKLEKTFARLGMSEAGAKVAAGGR